LAEAVYDDCFGCHALRMCTCGDKSYIRVSTFLYARAALGFACIAVHRNDGNEGGNGGAGKQTVVKVQLPPQNSSESVCTH
jgi:hypothetical protein